MSGAFWPRDCYKKTFGKENYPSSSETFMFEKWGIKMDWDPDYKYPKEVIKVYNYYKQCAEKRKKYWGCGLTPLSRLGPLALLPRGAPGARAVASDFGRGAGMGGRLLAEGGAGGRGWQKGWGQAEGAGGARAVLL